MRCQQRAGANRVALSHWQFVPHYNLSISLGLAEGVVTSHS